MSASGTAAQDLGAALARRLFVLFKAAAVYGPANDGYRAHSLESHEALGAALARSDTVRIEAREDRLYLNGAPIPLPPGEAGARFLCAEFRRWGAGGLEFRGLRSAHELDACVFALLGGGAHKARTLDETAQTLLNAGVKAIGPLPPVSPEDFADDDAPGNQRTATEGVATSGARRAFSQAVEAVEDVMSRAREGRSADFATAKSAAAELAEQVSADPQALFELSILQSFDEYTYAHCVNVSIYSIAIGERLGLRPQQISELGFGALFHDLGKARLPRELIDKPDEFDENDWRLMRRHPALGAATLLAMRRPMDATLARAISIAFEHHLGHDGTGYPKLSPPRRQDLFSRICAVADAFDAMTSGRVYAKRAMSPDEALRRMIQRAGSAFDPLMLRIFINTVGVFPIGTAVLLDTGERAVVRRNYDGELLRPQVVVLADAAGGTRAERGSIRKTLDPETNGIDARKILRGRALQ